MISKTDLIEFINSRLEGSDHFLVDVTVSADNDIVVEVDSDDNVDIDFCIALSKAVEAQFPRDVEDYSLEVGSAGLTSPFKVLRQYLKNVGQEVEVLTADGRKLKGVLDQADETGFMLGVQKKVKEPGAKRPVVKTLQESFAYTDVKYVKATLGF